MIEFKNNLGNILLERGLDPIFRDQPAYEDALSKVDAAISRMNMGIQLKELDVQEEKGVFAFTYYDTKGSKYTMHVVFDETSPEMFSFTTTESRFLSGRQEKSCKRTVVTLANQNQVDIKEYSALAVPTDSPNCCDVSGTFTETLYDEYGIMYSLESKVLKQGTLSRSIANASVSDMLTRTYLADGVNERFAGILYRDLLRRDYFDTALLLRMDGNGKTLYRSQVPLNQEHGLKNMKVMGGGFDNFVEIPPRSIAATKSIISREQNAKVREGLKSWAVGRERYLYMASEDKNFVPYEIASSQSQKNVHK